MKLHRIQRNAYNDGVEKYSSLIDSRVCIYLAWSARLPRHGPLDEALGATCKFVAQFYRTRLEAAALNSRLHGYS